MKFLLIELVKSVSSINRISEVLQFHRLFVEDKDDTCTFALLRATFCIKINRNSLYQNAEETSPHLFGMSFAVY
jgi:hypothetical protein